MEEQMYILTHKNHPAWSCVEELMNMKWQKRDMMFLWRREGSDIREVWVQGKMEGDFHGTVEGWHKQSLA